MPRTFRSLIILATIMTASCSDGRNNESTISSSTMMSTTASTVTASTDTTIINSTTVSMVDSTLITMNSRESAETVTTLSSISSGKDSKKVSTTSFIPDSVWECPNITKTSVECSCDFPHTLRCTGERTALQVMLIYYYYY